MLCHCHVSPGTVSFCFRFSSFLSVVFVGLFLSHHDKLRVHEARDGVLVLSPQPAGPRVQVAGRPGALLVLPHGSLATEVSALSGRGGMWNCGGGRRAVSSPPPRGPTSEVGLCCELHLWEMGCDLCHPCWALEAPTFGRLGRWGQVASDACSLSHIGS